MSCDEEVSFACVGIEIGENLVRVFIPDIRKEEC